MALWNWMENCTYETNGTMRIKNVRKVTKRVYAKRLWCDLSIFGQYRLDTNPSIMKEDEHFYISKTTLRGEEQAIEAIAANILPQINAVEDITIQGHHYATRMFILSSKIFEAFAKHGVDLRFLRRLKIVECVLIISVEEMNIILQDSKLEEFHYIQGGTLTQKHPDEPVKFLSDVMLTNISVGIDVFCDVPSFCWDVTDVTIEKWKTTMPANIRLKNCNTSFTLKAIWELIQIARCKGLPVKWSFGYILPSENNAKTLIQMQKDSGISWYSWTDGHYKLKLDVLTKQNSHHFIDFILPLV